MKFSTATCQLDSTVPDWISDHPETQSVFESFSIDCSCGGKSLGYLCDQRGLDRQTVLTAVRRKVKPQLMLKADRFKIVRFVMATDELLAEHQAPDEITVQCLQGKLLFTAQGESHPLSAGQILYLPAAVPHSVLSLENATFLLTILTPGGSQSQPVSIGLPGG